MLWVYTFSGERVHSINLRDPATQKGSRKIVLLVVTEMVAGTELLTCSIIFSQKALAPPNSPR